MGARKSKSHSVVGNRVASRKEVSGGQAREKVKEQKVKQINKGESKMSIFEEMNKLNDHFFNESDKIIDKYKYSKEEKDELQRDVEQEKILEAKDIKEEQDLSMFKSHWVGGQRVIDLTSVDEDYREYESFDRGQDIERQQIYGDKAWSTKF